MSTQKILSLLTILFLFFGLITSVHAALITIGTANYLGSDYNLIWDDDNNGNSVVWLDYRKSVDLWQNQLDWATNLDAALTINLEVGYNVTWDDAAWRLPSTVDGPLAWGYEGDPDGDGLYSYTVGYNLVNSEMGHLYYTELGNMGYYDTSGNFSSDIGLINTGDFNNLYATGYYWSGTEVTEFPANAFHFYMSHGDVRNVGKDYSFFALALRSGQVSVVPEPGTIWLLGSGLIGLAALRRRRKGNCVC